MAKYVEVPDELYENVEEEMEIMGYTTFSEFVKGSIRIRAKEIREHHMSDSDEN